MAQKILITEEIVPAGIEILKEKGYEVDCKFDLSREALLDIIEDYDALIVRSATKVDREIFEIGKKLRVVGRAGVGIDNIDIEAANAYGVIDVYKRQGLMFVAGYLIAASADNAFSLLMLNIPLAFVQIFGLGKPLARYLERLRSHDWVLRLTSTLRLRLFRVVQHQQRKQAHWRTGDVLGSLASDIEPVQNLFLRCVFPVLIAWIVGVLLVAVAGFMSPGLLLFALIAFLLLCVIIPALAVVLNRARIERNDRTRASLYAEVTDKVLGSRDIAIAGRGGEITGQLLSLIHI